MATKLNETTASVTERIKARSRDTRAAYLAQMREARRAGRSRERLSCGNLAHAFAACDASDKEALARGNEANIGIVTAYNDMLSAHQPLKDYPDILKAELRKAGSVGQVAGGVPAMCDGVTQGRPGMDLSLFSRDVIAMGTAVAFSHDMFDAGLCLGVCDKIVPGLMIGALRFGHLPMLFVPAGPMRSGLSNDEKAKVRQLYAEGKVGRDKLLAAEAASYHSPGTCTFYGTANSNQMLMEFMGMHAPGAAFPNPGTPLREALTRAAARRIAELANLEGFSMAEVIDERAIVNGVVGLHATGGSTNHTLHLIAIARAAGIILTWDDMDALSSVTPLLARVYPNGKADVNQFHAAGGLAFVLRELIDAGLVHADVATGWGQGLAHYAQTPMIEDGALVWRDPPKTSGDEAILRPAANPFSPTGGCRVLKGPLGRSVIKVSAVKPEHRVVEAPAAVYEDQESFLDDFKAGKLNRDFVAVLRFQGPRANGMPELHKLTPALGVLQDKGFKVALVTDGRMSGASGKVPAAIHLTPEAVVGGPIARVENGDVIRLDTDNGTLGLAVAPEKFAARKASAPDLAAGRRGYGRELFTVFRANATSAEEGALSIPFEETCAPERVPA